MGTPDTCLDVVYRAIDQTNQLLDGDRRLSRAPDTVLFGEGGILTSLELVALIADVEELLEDEIGVTVILADERALSQKTSPFRTARSLADYAATLVEEQRNG
jgi:D-alanine--poly(phosphoribitol) ligase subunit 2